MPFSNPILGGTTLVRSAINSPNYVPNTSGWSINADGTVDLSGGTFRGAVLLNNPPAVGAASYGLTGAAIPAALLTFNADYTWYEADVFWIDGTQFIFNAWVNNTAFGIVERISGIYLTATGVQLQDFVPSTAPNTKQHGTAFYDTQRLQEQWRASDVSFDDASTVEVDGALNFGSTATANWYAVARKSVENQNNTTVLQSDPQLFLDLDQSGTPGTWRYQFSGWLCYQTTAVSGLQLTFVGDGAGIINGDIRYSTDWDDTLKFGAGAASKAGVNTSFHVVKVFGHVNVTGGGGRITLQWAQLASSAGPTFLLQNSWLRADRGAF